MIAPEEIRDKATRLYPQFVQAWLAGEDFFPRPIPCNLRPSTVFSQAAEEMARLRAGSKEALGFGYTVEWENRNSRRYSQQDFAVAIRFDTQEDLLKLIGRTTEFRQWVRSVELIRNRCPELESWLRSHWKRLPVDRSLLSDLLDVVHYLQQNPRPNCFVRELPLAISTKLVEEHAALLSQWLDEVIPDGIDYSFDRGQFAARYGFRAVDDQVLLRLLDASLLKELQCPSGELALPVAALRALPVVDLRVVLVENKINLLTLPAMPRTLAMGGLGKGITRLFRIPWLEGAPITYWGDIDVEGLQILALVRNRFPQVRSLLMDQATLERYRSLAIEGNPHASDLPVPMELAEHEAAAFVKCRDQQLRLEQERIPQADVNAAWS